MGVQSMSLSENIYGYYTQLQSSNRTNRTSQRQILSHDLANSFEIKAHHALNPKQQILDDYYAWKAIQPKRTLPDSKGATEENLKYLQKNFSGKLDLFERVEVLDTMREMGILSEDQMLNYLGLGESTITVITEDTPHIVITPPDISADLSSWMDFFSHYSLGFCDNLEKLLKVIDVRFRNDGNQNVAEQIQAILNKTTHKYLA